MKNSKKGISLIVLVITIIVIIILAAAVILTMQKSNPIADARTAVEKEDYTEAQNAYNMWLSKVMVKQLDTVTFTGWIGKSSVISTLNTKATLGKTEDKTYLQDKAIDTITTTDSSVSGATVPSKGFMTSSGAKLNSEVINELVSTVSISTLGLPEQVKAIYVKDNRVIGLYKNSTVSFLNVSKDEITVDQTID